jgi:hypothetical protein
MRSQLRSDHGAHSLDLQFVPADSSYGRRSLVVTDADLPVLGITRESLAKSSGSTARLTFSGDPKRFRGEAEIAVRELGLTQGRTHEPPRDTTLGGRPAISYEDDLPELGVHGANLYVIALRRGYLYTLTIQVAPRGDLSGARALLDAVRSSWAW